MAKLARAELFASDEIACVHAINRAFRRTYLMGDDPLTGKHLPTAEGVQPLKHFAGLFGITSRCCAPSSL